MKKIKRLLASLMVVIMVLTTAPVSGFAELDLTGIFNISANAQMYSGKCGDNLTWTLDTETGHLVIGGIGDMYDYGYGESPWQNSSLSVKKVTINSGVTSIGDYAFFDCGDLVSVIIPESVTRIKFRAFDSCTSLANVTIPDGVTQIGHNAFAYCTSLASVTIPDSVTTIVEDVFVYCTILTNITVDEGNPEYSSDKYGVLFNKAKTKLIHYPIGNTRTNYTIPDSVVNIGNHAFAGCTSLTSITIPSSVIVMGSRVFDGCSSITNITIPDSVTDIGDGLFENCSSLTSVIVSGSITSIGYYTFSGCTNLVNIRIPDAVTKINPSAFSSCVKLTSISIPDGVNTIERDTFYDCDSLTSVTIPDSVTTIGHGAFSGCRSLTSVTIPDSVTTLGDDAFRNCDSLTSITIPDSVTTIGVQTFYSCDSLTSVTIPDSVTTIGYNSFANCTNIKRLSIPDGVRCIDKNTFFMCKRLTTITIPGSVTGIGENAFSYCNRLADVYYGGTEESWKNITIGSGNAYLTNATIHYGSVAPDIPQSAVVQENLDYYIEEDDAHKKLSMQVTLRDEWFAKDSAEYNHDLGGFCSQFTVLGYTKASHMLTDEQKENGTRPAGYITKNQVLKNALTKMGFSDPVVELSAPREGVNHFVTNKKITVNGQEYTLIFIGLIGSYMEQWYSNFDPGTGRTHMGFNGAKNYVSAIVGEYIKNHNLDKSKTKVLITGHSRGAATSNLLAKEFISGSLSRYANPSNVYTYAFATPNSTSLPERNDEIYKRIFNIVNPEDFVTKVLPTAWRFGNYGTTYTLPSRTNTKHSEYKVHLNKMQTYFKQLKSGEAYAPYIDGEVTVYNLVEKFTSTVKSLDDFNNKEMRFAALTYITPWDFFQIAICPLVGESIGSSGFVSGITNFALCLADIGAAKTYREFAKFFLWYAVLDKVNKMAPEAINIFLPALASATGVSEETLLAGCEGYFEDSHCAETYCAYMMTLPKAELVKEKKSLSHTVNCPVDVEVVDKATGDVVGRIVNNVIDEEIAAKDNAIVMTVDGDSKSFWLPSDGDYDVRLTGNDEGTMDYTVSEIDSNIGETQRVNFFDVSITDGKEMTGEINSEDFVLEEYTLSFEDESAPDMIPTEIMSDDAIINYNIDINVEGYGNATESMTVASGDYVSLVATPIEGNEFLGWYEDGALISTDMQYSFVAKSDREITAKFKAIIGDVNSDGKINSTDALLCLQHSVGKIKLEGDAFTAADVDKNGFVNSSDALKILQFSVGKIDKL